MSKLDNSIINNIKMLSLDMIKEAGSGLSKQALNCAPIFYALYIKHLKFKRENPNWINRDRVITSNHFLPVMYSTLHLIGYNISMDNLKEYKKFNSLTPGFSSMNTPGIEVGSNIKGDVISSAIGIALGERYLESLVKIEKPKCNLINFNTYCICSLEDFMNGLSYESLAFASREKLNKLTLIVVKDEINKDSSIKDIYPESVFNSISALDFNVIDVKGNDPLDIEDAIDEANDNKRPSIIFVNINNKTKNKEITNTAYNKPLSNEEMNYLRDKYKINGAFTFNEEHYQEINRQVSKRLEKELVKWDELKNECLKDLKIKEIIEFLETKNLKIEVNVDNIKINDNYEEDLITGNAKIFNILANKSPFVLSASNDNFVFTKTSITKSGIMNNENPIGRNILFGNNTLAMGGIANGLASLGFKLFVSAPLIDSNLLKPFIKYSAINNLPVNYIFTQDSFTNTYENVGYCAIEELNNLRLIPNLINFRPADINEVIGMYSLIGNYKKATSIVIGSDKVKKISGTNPKYVVAGAYRVKREKGEANGILIATGSEVSKALKIAEELLPYGIDFRVVTMPCQELFELQNNRYKYGLLPKELKTFVIEFSNSSGWYKYATGEEYILGINQYNTGGTKEELLKYYKLDNDSIKAKIIELMKN